MRITAISEDVPEWQNVCASSFSIKDDPLLDYYRLSKDTKSNYLWIVNGLQTNLFSTILSAQITEMITLDLFCLDNHCILSAEILTYKNSMTFIQYDLLPSYGDSIDDDDDGMMMKEW